MGVRGFGAGASLAGDSCARTSDGVRRIVVARAARLPSSVMEWHLIVFNLRQAREHPAFRQRASGVPRVGPGGDTLEPLLSPVHVPRARARSSPCRALPRDARIVHGAPARAQVRGQTTDHLQSPRKRANKRGTRGRGPAAIALAGGLIARDVRAMVRAPVGGCRIADPNLAVRYFFVFFSRNSTTAWSSRSHRKGHSQGTNWTNRTEARCRTHRRAHPPSIEWGLRMSIESGLAP
jgi:hypothetical protein